MRISDWSSDVCSSDLLDADTFSAVPEISIDYALMEKSSNVAVIPCEIGWSDIGSWTALSGLGVADEDGNRSEEHTSELQSLMRSSYAVFCLKKKKKDRTIMKKVWKTHTTQEALPTPKGDYVY